MTKYEYKPYRVGKRKNTNTRYLILALVVIIVVTVVLIKTHGDGTSVAGLNNSSGGGSSIDNPDEGVVETGSEAVAGGGNEAAPAASANTSQGSVTDAPGSAASADVTDVPPISTVTLPVAFNPIPHSTANMTKATLEVIDQSLKDLKAGKIIAARDSLNNVLLVDLTPEYRKSVKKRLTDLTAKWLFNREVLPGDTLCEYYRVKPGEVLEKIGKKYKVPFELLMRINGIERAKLLQAGQTIKVVKGPFHVNIYRSTFTMDLYLGNQLFIKSYRIGLGTKERETPTGRWRVKSDGKLIEPPWYDEETGKNYVAGDPEYPLGSRWIAIEGLDEQIKHRIGFAIHGTKDADSIGKRSSRGCIRLFNGDAIEVYDLLVPLYSEVRIVE
ncbi:MAG: hypothetical protein DRP66_05945 [Planctomycetota bacterium]|nr:MAG: hypothetical protein DRP66_05945 [Planctomycetota bacterium]